MPAPNLPRSPPGYNIRDATLADAEDITRVWYASFNQSHPFFDAATPDDESTRRWLNEAWRMGISAGPAVLRTFVVEDLAQDRRIVAFMRSHMPQIDGSQDIPLPELPAGWDEEVVDALWGGIARSRAKCMGNRVHMMGEFMGVEKEHRGKQIAAKLVEWICDIADYMGLETYFDATRDGLPIYKKWFNFIEIAPINMPTRPETYGTYEMVAMVRAPKESVLKSRL